MPAETFDGCDDTTESSDFQEDSFGILGLNADGDAFGNSSQPDRPPHPNDGSLPILNADGFPAPIALADAGAQDQLAEGFRLYAGQAAIGNRQIGPDSSTILPPLVSAEALRYVVQAGGNADNIGTSLMNFLVGTGPEIDFIYGPDTEVSERFWQHHEFLSPFRDWFYHGSKSFCRCNQVPPDTSTYWTGLQRVHFVAPQIDYLRDLLVNLGLDPLSEGLPYRDWHIQQFGSFIMDYQGLIDCASSTVSFHAVIFNAWSIASATRNPYGKRGSLLTGGRKVYEEVIIDKTGTACG